MHVARWTWKGEKNSGRKGKMRRYFSQLLKLGEASLRSIHRDDARAWVKSTRLSGNYGENRPFPEKVRRDPGILTLQAHRGAPCNSIIISIKRIVLIDLIF